MQKDGMSAKDAIIKSGPLRLTNFDDNPYHYSRYGADGDFQKGRERDTDTVSYCYNWWPDCFNTNNADCNTIILYGL